MNKTIKKFLIGLLAVVMPASILTFGTNNTYGDTETLPSQYETDNLPAVRNQNPYGTCWTFSTIFLAEIDLITNHGFTSDLDLSELQLAYYYHHNGDDPMGNNIGSKIETATDFDFLERGGNVGSAAKFLLSWQGVANEDTFPYSTAALAKTNGLDNDKADLNPIARAKSYRELSYSTDKELIKHYVMEQGAVSVSYNADVGSYRNVDGDCTRYISDPSYSANHAVAIVGWDDNYPAANFSYNGSSPVGNGAWIVRNSWGSSWGNDGYFYLSYYDATIRDSLFTIDFVPADEYDHNYQYETTVIASGIGNECANIYTATGNTGGAEVIKSVSFYVFSGNTNCTVEVYTDVEENSPISGTLAATKTGYVHGKSVYTFDFDEPVRIEHGQRFSAVVRLEDSSGKLGAEYYYNEGTIKHNSYIEAGQSFMNWYGWQDVKTLFASSPQIGNAIIKVFTSDLEETPFENIALNTSSLELSTGETSTLSISTTPSGVNVPVKWTSSDTSVATVSSTGVITAVHCGNAVITATTQNKNNTGNYVSKECTVTVNHTEVIDEAVESTCTQTGKTAGKHCSVCNTVLIPQEDTELKQHTEVIDEAVEVSCLTPGKTAGKHCSVCNQVIVAQTVIEPTGHMEVIDEAVAATCLTDGKTAGKHCSKCNLVIVPQTVIKAKGHIEENDVAIPVTCTTDGKTAGKHCRVCGTVIIAQEIIRATGHNEVVDEAVAVTCITNGKTEGKHCSTCGTVRIPQTIILAKGHTEVIDEAVEATCLTDGKTEGVHCSVCNAVIIAQTTIHAPGHNEVVDEAIPVTCISDGKTAGSHCSRCNTVFTAQEIIHAPGHTEVTDEAVAVTCTTDGKTAGKHCSVCNTVLVAQNTIYSKGHNFELKEIIKEADYDNDGEGLYGCTKCDATEHKIIPKLGKNKINETTINMPVTTYTYTGSAIKPAITVVYKGEILVENKDYTVKYLNNVNTGTASLTITGINTYEGTKSKNYTIQLSGTCGTNLKWSLNTGTGALAITGTGDMTNYASSDKTPWAKYRKLIKSVDLASGVTSVGNYAFANCENLIKVTGASGLKIIGVGAFYKAKVLNQIGSASGVINLAKVEKICTQAFYYCEKFTELKTGSALTVIGGYAFRGCYGMKKATIGPKCTSIGEYSFNACTSMTTVVGCTGLTSIGKCAFNADKALTTIGGTVGRIDLPSAQVVAQYAFNGCTAIKKVTFGSKMQTIGSYTFNNCSSLVEINFKTNYLNRVGMQAFSGTNKSLKIYVPSPKLTAYKTLLKSKGQASTAKILNY